MTGRDVVIVGAPRSGTNMLRDVLTALPEFGTWPCDEINPIWRHGNRDHPSDELTGEQATPEVRRFIRERFERVRHRGTAPRVVEKTCANSLRVEFVREVLPDAQYVFITRDGLDAAPSAVQRWHASLDVRYTAAKARYVPPSDLPYYGWRFVSSRLRRQTAAGRTTGWWGPRLSDTADLVVRHPVDEVAVIQWRRCVEASRRGLDGLAPDQLHHVAYEDFVRNPTERLTDLLRFLGVEQPSDPSLVSGVSSTSVGKGRESLTAEARSRLMALAAPELGALGYDV